MENKDKDRRARVIAIAALMLGVVGLSIGFAAFSNTLTIKSSAEVSPDEDIFNIDFSKSSGTIDDDPIVPVLNPTGVNGFTASNAIIDNDHGDATIKNLHAVFTEPGQEVTYSFYTKNAGELTAYLKSIVFANASGGSATKVCTAKTGGDHVADATLVQNACQGITLTLTVGSESFTGSSLRSAFASATAHDLTKGTSEEVQIRIAYETGSAVADGGFDVTFGDITLLYTSNE